MSPGLLPRIVYPQSPSRWFDDRSAPASRRNRKTPRNRARPQRLLAGLPPPSWTASSGDALRMLVPPGCHLSCKCAAAERNFLSSTCPRARCRVFVEQRKREHVFKTSGLQAIGTSFAGTGSCLGFQTLESSSTSNIAPIVTLMNVRASRSHSAKVGEAGAPKRAKHIHYSSLNDLISRLSPSACVRQRAAILCAAALHPSYR